MHVATVFGAGRRMRLLWAERGQVSTAPPGLFCEGRIWHEARTLGLLLAQCYHHLLVCQIHVKFFVAAMNPESNRGSGIYQTLIPGI